MIEILFDFDLLLRRKREQKMFKYFFLRMVNSVFRAFYDSREFQANNNLLWFSEVIVLNFL